MRTRVKMCGMTRIEDALYAAELGVDAIGLIFYEKSPRYIQPQQAKKIVAALPPFISTVGVFVNAEKNYVTQIATEVSLHLFQFHGDETPEYCEAFKKTYIKTISMREDRDILRDMAQYKNAQGFLLDTHKSGQFGGTGEIFDWKKIPHAAPKPLILAGGLTAENVGKAIKQSRPYGVDVVSGIEAEKGIKDRRKMQLFMQAVRSICHPAT